MCLKFSIAMVNSYEDTMDQKHFALRYESFLCYNHGEYLSHSRDIWVEKRKNNKNGTFVTTYFCIYLSSMWLLGNYMSLADHKGAQLKGESWVLK